MKKSKYTEGHIAFALNQVEMRTPIARSAESWDRRPDILQVDEHIRRGSVRVRYYYRRIHVTAKARRLAD